MVRIDPRHYRKALRVAREANDDLPELPKGVRHISKKALKGQAISAEEFDQLRRAEMRRGIKFCKVVVRNRMRLKGPAKAVLNRCAFAQGIRAEYDGMPITVVSRNDGNALDDDASTETDQV